MRIKTISRRAADCDVGIATPGATRSAIDRGRNESLAPPAERPGRPEAEDSARAPAPKASSEARPVPQPRVHEAADLLQ